MTQPIAAGLIFPSPTARPLDKANVAHLAESMKQIGLINPLCVRRVVRHRGTTPFDAYQIVTGHHRYAAALQLKWQEIKCEIWEGGDLEAELAEIDENLVRANLTPSQEAAAIMRRKQIYEEIHPETKAEANASSARKTSDNLSFVSSTSSATSKDRRTIERAAARGEALGADLDAIAGTSLDKGVELDALAKMPVPERKKLIDCAKAGEIVSARKVRDIKDADKAIGVVASEEFANWLMERTNLSEMNTIISWLEGTKPRDVIAAMRRIAA